MSGRSSSGTSTWGPITDMMLCPSLSALSKNSNISAIEVSCEWSTIGRVETTTTTTRKAYSHDLQYQHVFAERLRQSQEAAFSIIPGIRVQFLVVRIQRLVAKIISGKQSSWEWTRIHESQSHYLYYTGYTELEVAFCAVERPDHYEEMPLHLQIQSW